MQKINFFTLIFSHLRQKSFTTFLNVLFLAFGVGLVSLVLLVSHQLQENLYKDLRGIKMVIGAKGSPLQLIFCNIYHLQNPTGNIDLVTSEKIINNKRLVKKAIPLALGDNYEGFRIVGTTPQYPAHYKAVLAKGKFWEKPLQTVIGAEVAQKLGLKLGDTFASTHGLAKSQDHAHDHKKYVVSGILLPSQSVMDKLILTSIESIWEVHEHHENETPNQKPVLQKNTETNKETTLQKETNKETESQKNTETNKETALQKETEPQKNTEINKETESQKHTENKAEKQITAWLVLEYANNFSALQLPKVVQAEGNLQFAQPALEVHQVLAFFGLGSAFLQILGGIFVLLAGLSVGLALLNSFRERIYDLAMLRAMGASAWHIAGQVIMEGLILSGLGAIFGILLGHLGIFLLQNLGFGSLKISAFVLILDELYIVFGALLIGLFASLFPAWQAYKVEIFKVINK